MEGRQEGEGGEGKGSERDRGGAVHYCVVFTVVVRFYNKFLHKCIDNEKEYLVFCYLFSIKYKENIIHKAYCAFTLRGVTG